MPLKSSLQTSLRTASALAGDGGDLGESNGGGAPVHLGSKVPGHNGTLGIRNWLQKFKGNAWFGEEGDGWREGGNKLR